jgi:hypothetical protein
MNDARKFVINATVAFALGLAAAGTAQASTKVKADFNGDGFEDLAIGVPGETINGRTNAGAVKVIYGSANGLVKSTGKVQTIFQSQPGIVREFSEQDDFFGSTLTTGDFNGDGFDDLVIGVPLEDLLSGGKTLANAGMVHILFGSAAGLTDVNDQIFDQDSPGIFDVPEANALFGNSLAAGDFNKDGFDDLAIGVPGHSVAGAGFAGEVIVVRGSAAGLTATGSQGLTEAAIFDIPQFSEAGDQFGFSLAAGDFGGDGFADLAIGVPFEDFNGGVSSDPTDRGAVVILYGSTVGLNFQLRDSFSQDKAGMLDDAEPFDRFGYALAAGDFNGDGRDDLAVGIQGEDIVNASGVNIAETGAVAVIYGSNIGGGLRVEGNQFWHQDVAGIEDINETGDGFGEQLATGDFNGDGRDDLAIGVPFEDLGGAANSGIQNAGVVEVIYGTAAGLSSVNDQRWSQDSVDVFTNTFIIDQAEANDNVGGSLATGDFNGDGRDDLAIGVPAEDVDLSIIDSGGVNVIFGTAAGLAVVNNQFLDQPLFSDFPASGERFGLALAGQGNRGGGSAGFSGAWVRIAEHCGKGECRIQGRLDVTNPGTALAAASIVRFYLSNDETLDAADLAFDEAALDPLGPGETVRVRLRSEAPTGTAAGRFVIAVLDATNVVPEINEANNVIISEAIR